MIKYPKIDTLYKREFTERDPVTGEIRYLKKGKGEKNKLVIGDYATLEFESIQYWTVTEKMDGTNIRIEYSRPACVDKAGSDVKPSVQGKVNFGGRTDNASIPAPMVRYLTETFTVEKFQQRFPNAMTIVLFGEGIGGKIQCPEGALVSSYGDKSSLVLFDAIIDGWWLEPHKVWELANDLGIKSVPNLQHFYHEEKFGDMTWVRGDLIWTKKQIEDFIQYKPKSQGYDHIIEGIVARAHPQMFFRDRDKGPIMFKLKVRDYE